MIFYGPILSRAGSIGLEVKLTICSVLYCVRKSPQKKAVAFCKERRVGEAGSSFIWSDVWTNTSPSRERINHIDPLVGRSSSQRLQFKWGDRYLDLGWILGVEEGMGADGRGLVVLENCHVQRTS